MDGKIRAIIKRLRDGERYFSGGGDTRDGETISGYTDVSFGDDHFHYVDVREHWEVVEHEERLSLSEAEFIEFLGKNSSIRDRLLDFFLIS
jgi:hypothetical protein